MTGARAAEAPPIDPPEGIATGGIATGGIAIDEESLLVHAPGATPLGAVEAALAAAGLTLGLDDLDAVRDRTVASWLAAGAPGAPDAWRDPVDHLVAGLDARLPSGERLEVRPAPRRAVGPDLIALFVGAGGRFGAIDRAWLRVHRDGARRPETSPFALDRDPPVSPEEEALLAAIERELAPR